MTLIQVGVVQLGVVQLGLVQMGVDPAMTGVLRIYNTQTKINIKLRLFQLILFTVTVFSRNQSGAKFRECEFHLLEEDLLSCPSIFRIDSIFIR